jgi:predicted permease
VLAWWALRSIIAISPTTIPRVGEVRIDLTVGLVTLGIAVLTGLLFGLAPAMQLTRTDLQSTLKEGTRGGTAGRHTLGRALVVGEIALAVVVVIGAALLVRSFNALRNVDPGFKPDRLLVVDMAIPASRYDPAATTTFYQSLVERIRGLPGVQGAMAASEVPPVANGMNWDILVAGRASVPGQGAPSPNVRFVTRDYFSTLSIPVLRGRAFTNEDRGTTPPVVLINETTARVVFPTGNAVGQQVRFGSGQPWMTIVGISKDVHSQGLGDEAPAELYLLHEQLPAIAGGSARTMYLVARTSGDPMALAAAARNTIKEMDPQLAITAIRSMDDIIAESVARPRFTTTLLGAFGIVALALAAIGIYGIMSYGVKRRTREIGIRMALGAGQKQVLSLIVRQGMALTLTGLAAGVGAALYLSQWMTKVLFGVKPTDPWTYTATALILTAVAFAATMLPARRAVLTDPSTALRAE